MAGGNWMKKITYSLIIIILLIQLSNNFIYAEEMQQTEPDLTENASAAILLERDTGQVLFEKNAHEKLPPASMTKVMTLLLVMEAIDSGTIAMDEKLTISANAASMGGSQVFLAEGEQMTVKDLIKSVAIASANDASVALAERLAGSEAAFVQQMNHKAKQLKLENTHFQNSSGLPASEHYSTAYDMAIMAKELLKYDKITSFTSIYEDYLRKGTKNEFWLVNTNKLVRFYPYVDGLKTGYTSEAKFCLTATAKKDDMRVVTVVMGANTSKERNAMTMNLINFAFNHYESEKLFNNKETVTQLRQLKSEKSVYDIKTNEPISVLHKKGMEKTNYASEIQVLEDKTLPLKKGEQVGTIFIKKDGEKIYESPLIVEENVEVASLFTLIKRSIAEIAKYPKL